MQREDLSDAVKSLKEMQEFAVRQYDSDMLGVISQAKVFVESQAAKITHNDAAQSVGLLWTSDQLVAETST